MRGGPPPFPRIGSIGIGGPRPGAGPRAGPRPGGGRPRETGGPFPFAPRFWEYGAG
eukprot:SAG31_NODE_1405_length_8488_cov_2.786029_5_plen_56_part_00